MTKFFIKHRNIFIVLVTIIGGVFFYLFHKKYVLEYLIMLATSLSAVFIWWQGESINKQLKIQIITDLYKEWNGVEMRKIRSNSFNANTDDLDKAELVLEFLEKIACYCNKNFLDQKILWDYFGWYIIRYYFYNRQNIQTIREKWSNDKTLYCELETLYSELIKQESAEIENHLSNEKDNFIKSEKYEIPK